MKPLSPTTPHPAGLSGGVLDVLDALIASAQADLAAVERTRAMLQRYDAE